MHTLRLAQSFRALLLVWATLAQLFAPFADIRARTLVKGSPTASDKTVWLNLTGEASGETAPTDLDLTDAVVTRHAPTINGGSIDGSIRILTAHEAGPAGFPASVPIATGTRTITIKAQSAVANIGNWETVRDLNVSGANITIDVPPGNYRTFSVNGNSRLRFTAGTYNFANTLVLDGSATLQTTGRATINIAQDLTINSGAVVAGSYTSPGDVHVNVLGQVVNIKGSSQLSAVLRAENGMVTLSGTAQLRGQIVANRLMLNGGKVIGAVWPARTDDCYSVFGGRRFDRTTGQPNQYVEQFSLPSNVGSPFTLHVQNGADGTNRASSATVKLNAVELIKPNDLNQNIATLDRDVNLAQNNQLDVRIASEPGSFLIINICGTPAARDTTPPTISITVPTTNATTTDAAITVSGTASDTGGIAHVYVNNIVAAYNSDGGAWSIDNVPVAFGENQITVRAVDPVGNESTATISITRESPANQAPTSDAGADQTLALPHSALLHGMATDDGLPDGSSLEINWTMVSGPGKVIFTDASAVETTASFSAAGTYVLRFTATDSDLSASDDVTITVQPQNQPPTVTAGPDQTIALPQSAALNGTITDDGWPSGTTVTGSWSKVSGPGEVTFEDATLPQTVVSFSEAGSYVLRLSANDTDLSSLADVSITVHPQNQPPTVDAGQDQIITLPSAAQLSGIAADDGWPINSSLSTTWTLVTGSAAVAFDDPHARNTTVRFALAGTYVLRLTASDTEFFATDDITITVIPQNLAPVVEAGADQNIALPRVANLNGSGSDDGLPSGSVLNLEWSKISGPGAVTFANPAAPATSASFSETGIYVLRLTINDGALTTFDELTVTVSDARTPPIAEFVADGLISLPGQSSVALAQSPSLLANGGAIYRSTYAGGSATANGLLGYNIGGWNPTIASRPDAIIQLSGSEPRTIKGVKLANMHTVISQTLEYGVRNFEVWVSSTTPDDLAFTKTLTATATLTPRFQTFLFPAGPVQARYIKYVPLTNGGSSTINTQAFDVIAEGAARVVASSGESESNFNPPEAAFDLDSNSIWYSQNGGTSNVWVKISLAGEESRKVYGVRIFPVNDFANGQRGPKDFEVRVSTTTADDAAFTTIHSGTVSGVLPSAAQEFLFPALVNARYVQFFFKNGYTPGANIGVRSLEVLGAPADGAVVIAVSSQEQPASNVLDLDSSNQWVTALNQPANQWLKVLLPGAELATLHHVALRPAISTNGSYSAPKDFELQVSTTDAADASFTSVLTATLSNSTQLQDFYFAPVQARYVRLLLKTNYAGTGRYGLARFHLYSVDQLETTTHFIDRSSDNDGSIVNWFWNFGDGTSSTEQHPTHTFSLPGQYTVSLTVTDNSDLSHSRQMVYRVINSPQANFAFSPVIAHEGGETVQFTDVTQLFSMANTLRRYDFGDGSSVTQNSNVSLHRFDDSGTFPVTLRLTDSLGADYSVTKNVLVLNISPSVDIDPGRTLVWGQPWTSVPRIDDQSPIDRLSLHGEWKFGDGHTAQCANCTNANATVTHAYSHPGSYQAALTVTDKDGGVASDTADFVVNKRPINLTFENVATPQVGELLLVRVRVMDSFGNQPLAGRTIHLALNGTGANAVTDANGFAEAAVTFAAGLGVNTATATFEEEEFYLGGSTYRVISGAANASACTRSSAGTDFWLMFPGNNIERSPGPTEGTFLDISSQVATTGTVAVPGLNIIKPFSVAANSTTRIQVNTEVTNNNLVENRGIHVVSQQPVTVYGLNNQFATVDAYLGLPAASLGNNYVVLGYSNGGVLKGTQFGVVAVAAATTLTITPSVTVGSRTAGVPYTLTLNQGQTYMLRDDVSEKGDLSGTFIQSDKPIAVFAGHRCANVPVPISYCDYVVEQLPPTDAWGTHFATLPLATRTKGDTFRFLAASDNTHVFLNSSRVATLNRGQFFETIIEGPGEIVSDLPILVAQYSNSHQYDNGLGDPFMMVVPPLEHYLNSYTVASLAGFNPNLINVIAPSPDIGAVTIDGAAIPASAFVAIGATGVSGAQLTVTPGTHNLSGPHPFGVYVYGFGLDISYGYAGSACLSSALGPTNVSLLPKSQNATIGASACVTATVRDQKSIPVSSQTVSFKVTGAHPQTASVISSARGESQFCYPSSASGDDLVTATNNGSSDMASVSWRLPNQAPLVNAGADQEITLPVKVSLAASALDDGLPSNTLSFSWEKVSGPAAIIFDNVNAASTTTTFSTEGVYVIRLTVSDGELISSDELQVTVNAAPLNSPPTVKAGTDQSATIHTNLVINGGADQPLIAGKLPGWSEVEGSKWSKGSANSGAGFPEPQRGDSDFFAGDVTVAELTQDVDVSVFAATIDAGSQLFDFNAYVRSAAESIPDSARIIVEYRDALNANVIGTLNSGEITSTNGWHLTEDIRISPAGTRWIRIRLLALRQSGATNDALFDSISLRPLGNAAIKLDGSISDDGLPYGSVLSRVWSVVSGPASIVFTDVNTPATAAIFTVAGTYVLRLTANDGEATVSDDVTVIIEPANQAPVVIPGANQTITLPASANLSGNVTDDDQPPGSSVSTRWRKLSGPGEVTFANPAEVVTTASFGAAGVYVLRLTADDSEYETSADITIIVNLAATAVNQPPTVDPGPPQTISPPIDTVTLNGVVTDDGLPAENVLTISWSKFSGPGAVTFGSPASQVTTAQFSATGSYVLRLTASDGVYVASADVGVVLTAPNVAPLVEAGTDQTILLSQTAQLNGSASDDGLPNGNVTTSWSKVSGLGTVSFANPNMTVTGASFNATGVYVLRLTADDGALIGTDDVTITVLDDVAPPTVAISSPEDGVEVTAPITITGSVSNGAWVLEYSLNSQDGTANQTWTGIAAGNGPTTGALGTLDTTLMLNGIYTLRLRATDDYLQTGFSSIAVLVEGNLKVGQFQVAFSDLNMPVSGIPIEVIRSYDSRDKRSGDFGVGWQLGIKSARIEKTGVLGFGWYQTASTGVIPTYCLEPARPHKVAVTFGDGRVFKFSASTAIHCQQLAPISATRLTFTAEPGTHATLESTTPTDVIVEADGSIPGPVTLINQSNPDIYNTGTFRLTTPEGAVYVIDQLTGINSVRDAYGNTLTISSAGIVHSTGQSISFVRDTAGRITQITDPNGNAQTYVYDATGDLVSHSDGEHKTTTFSYNSNHQLMSITDARGVELLTNQYDGAGRLIGQVDAFSKSIAYDHDIAGRAETITNRLGQSTTYEYDDRGNVLRQVDARGGVRSFTYDAFDNLLTETNELGKTTTYTYDQFDNRTSITDPLNHITTFTYNAARQPLTVTDARGHMTTNTYDAAGMNLLSTTDALDKTTTFGYSVFTGQRTTMKDALNHSTLYGYDSLNRLASETDASGNVTSYGYDANGNRTSQTVTRTNAASQQETITTTYDYDKLNRVTKTTFADGSFTEVEYNTIGQQSATVDQLGHRTEFTYDEMGRLTRTDYPDRTHEETTYDAEGHRVAGTDRAGHVTSFSYDELGRLIKTTFADNTSTPTTYNAAGEVLSTKDARGNVTSYEYDDAGRRTKTTNALNLKTAFSYDANGNQVAITDALLHTTTFEYDNNNRRTKTSFPDGSFDLLVYDAVGRNVLKTDQAGKTTEFSYDALGRLRKVKDTVDHETTYGYNELGQQISQTDANNHTTQFEYDQLGRRTRRILSAGQYETYSYDNAGNLRAKTDFNGKTTSFSYDAMSRLILKSPDSSLNQPTISFVYNVNGQRATMTDASGVTTYSYDPRNRLSTKLTPFGRLSYSYDDAGNLSTIRSSNANGARTDYDYDALNRLSTVKDHNVSAANNGVTTYAYDGVGNLESYAYANDLTTSHHYNALNRLTSTTALRSAAIVSSYSYTLGPTGNRTAVTELTGRTVTYTYDDLYRLTGETIAGDPNDGVIGYTYDAVGNRLSRHSSVPGVPAQNLTYDSNDRVSSDVYDNNGNTTTSNGNSYTYDFENRLASANAGTITYLYDGDGNRVGKTVDGLTTNYLVHTNNHTGYAQVVEELQAGAVVKQFTYGHDLISQRCIQRTTNCSLSFYGYDGHGSVRFLTDANGDVTDTYDYDAFGNLINRTGITSNDYLYSGEQFDADTGLYYLRARYVNAASGRFWTMDSYEGGAHDPSSLHKYVYVKNDPTGLVDPSGQIGIASIIGEVNTVCWRASLFIGQYQRSLAAGKLILDLLDVALTFGDPEYRDFSLSMGHMPFASVAYLAADARLAFRYSRVGSEAPYLARGIASSELSIVNAGSNFPEKELLNFTKWGASPVTVQPGEVLYRVHTPGKSTGPWWTRVKPQSEIQLRIDCALRPEWNDARQLSTVVVPQSHGLEAWEGTASYQGGFYIGGGNQLFIPNIPLEWITTVPFK